MTTRFAHTGLLLSLLAFGHPCIVGGQTHQPGPWSLLAMGGAQAVWLNDPLGLYNGPMTGRRVQGMGYLFGAGLERRLSSRAGLRPELHWSERVTSMSIDESQAMYSAFDVGETVDIGTLSYRMRSLALPLCFTWEQWPGCTVLGGPAAARTLEVRERFTGTRYDGQQSLNDVSDNVDRTADFAPWEWALVAGFEVRGKSGFRAGLRYWKGLSDLEALSGTTPSRSSVLQFLVALPVAQATVHP